MNKRLAVPLLAAVAMVIAGCGGTSQSSAPTSPVTSLASNVAAVSSAPASSAIESGSPTAAASDTAAATVAAVVASPTDTAAPASDTPTADTAATQAADPAASDTNLPVLIIHPLGEADYGVIRPASVASSGDGKQIIDKMIWSSWTATAAHADAAREVQSCSPSCAEGTINPVPMTFDLSKPVDGHFTQVIEVINGETTTITDSEGFAPGDLGFVGAILGAASQSLAATPAAAAPAALPTETAGGPAETVNVFPVLMIYPDGASVYAVVKPDSLSGTSATSASKIDNIVWDHWTTTEAVGTGAFTPANSSVPPFQLTLTLTNPVNGAFSTFHYVSVTGNPKLDPDTYQYVHYKAATPDSARVPIPCTC